MAALDRRRDLVLADYQAALTEGDAKARIVLEVATRIDAEHDALAARLADAEAHAAEWEDADDSGLAESVDLVRALARADTAEALNRAMAKAVAGIHVAITADGRLRAEFALKHPEGVPYLFRHAKPVGLAGERITLPDAPADERPVEPCGSPRSTAAWAERCVFPNAGGEGVAPSSPSQPARSFAHMTEANPHVESAEIDLPRLPARSARARARRPRRPRGRRSCASAIPSSRG